MLLFLLVLLLGLLLVLLGWLLVLLGLLLRLLLVGRWGDTQRVDHGEGAKIGLRVVGRLVGDAAVA